MRRLIVRSVRFVFKIIRSFWHLTCNLNYQSRGFETSWEFTIRRLIGYWNAAQFGTAAQSIYAYLTYRGMWRCLQPTSFHSYTWSAHSCWSASCLAHTHRTPPSRMLCWYNEPLHSSRCMEDHNPELQQIMTPFNEIKKKEKQTRVMKYVLKKMNSQLHHPVQYQDYYIHGDISK